MNPSEYQRAAARTECDQRHSLGRFNATAVHPGGLEDWLLPVRLNHAVIGLAGEAGELAGLVEKWLYYGQALDPARWKDELGDCLWYIALACNALGLDLGEVMEANIRKLRARYPEGYADALAAERDRQAEAAALEQQALVQVRPAATQDGHGWGHHPDAPC